MNIEVGKCHFGWFEHEECVAAEQAVKLAAPQTAMAQAFAKAQ